MMTLIDANEASRAVCNVDIPEGVSEEAFVRVLDNVCEALSRVPTAEPKRGRLERLLKEKVPGKDWCLCVARFTCCGHLLPVPEECVAVYNYCPNCGAGMVTLVEKKQ